MPTLVQVILGFAGLGLVIGLLLFFGSRAPPDKDAADRVTSTPRIDPTNTNIP